MKKSARSTWILVGFFALLCGVLVVIGALSEETEVAGSMAKPRSTPAATRVKEDAAELLKQGKRYYSGEGVPRDFVKAVSFFRRSAELGQIGRAHV